jgi:hypothetical protein
MLTFKTGDLIAKRHAAMGRPLQVGLIISANKETFTIKWTSYNKDFFMEKEEDIFEELNKSFLLNTVQVSRANTEANLTLLSSNYNNVNQKEKTPEQSGEKAKENTSTNCWRRR